jgi:C1q domain
MKKILLLSLCISLKAFGQSVTISPQTIDKQNSTNDDLKVTSYNKPPSIVGLRANGTVPMKTRVLLGDLLMKIEAGGFDGFGFFNGGRINFKATQNWDFTNGTAITFETTSNTNFIPVERMVINHDGNVGIGLSSPTLPLDVNGRIRLRNNGGSNTSGIWFDNSAAAQRVFMGMETDDLFGFYGTPGWSFRFNATNGNIGISTVPTANKLEVNGSIGSVSLAGTGNNQLYANSTGTIIATAPVAFSVKSNVGLTPISNATITTFPFNTENYDLGSFFDNSLYEFSAPLNGVYHFDCAVTFGVVNSASSTSGYEMNILVDGSSSANFSKNLKVGGYETLNLSQDIKLNAGQKVKISVYQNSGNAIQLIGNANSFFTGHLITRL